MRMKRRYSIGTLAGLKIMVNRSVFPSSSMIWVGFGVFTYYFLHLDFARSVAGGFAALLLHWVGELWHQFGHAIAARRTGYPMKGILLWGILSSSIYPAGEPELPAAIHIRRAMGGIPASLLLSALGAVFVFLVRPANPLAVYLSWFVFLENLLVFGFGSLLPLGFTDGSTLLRYWRQR